jgi:hypothetical protein
MGSAEIKDAITAIRTNPFSKISIGSSLGNDAKFTNCQNGIEMLNDNYTTSKIIKAIFNYQNSVELGFNEALNNHIYLNNINGLNIWGSQFINSDASSNVISGTYRGTGIKAINSNFNVLKNQANVNNLNECHPPSQTEPPCLFQSLSIGIDAVYLIPSYYTGYPIKVLNNQFNDCRHAMHFANGNNIILYENEINIESSNIGQEPIYQLDGNYGITMNGVSQFQIIQNKIQINDLSRFSHGISIINSDYLSAIGKSIIYKNETNAQAFANNKNIALKVSESSSNLKIECNSNTNISTDWVFNPFTNITQIGTTNLAAGNSFAKESFCPALNDVPDWYHAELIQYYYNGNCANFPAKLPMPKNFPVPGVTFPNPIGVNSNNCPDSSSCHVSRWTPELNTSYSGSVIFFPPVPPPNDNLNENQINEEKNRILHGIPLIDNNSSIPVISDMNSERSAIQKNETYQIYPNPVSLENPRLSFSNFLISDNRVKVHNLSGQDIDFEFIDVNTIQLHNISKGVYIIKIINSNHTYSIKFVVID